MRQVEERGARSALFVSSVDPRRDPLPDPPQTSTLATGPWNSRFVHAGELTRSLRGAKHAVLSLDA
jgi:hypothetical protein